MKEEDGRRLVLKRYGDNVSRDPDTWLRAELLHSYQLHSEVWVYERGVNCYPNLYVCTHTHKHNVAVPFDENYASPPTPSDTYTRSNPPMQICTTCVNWVSNHVSHINISFILF